MNRSTTDSFGFLKTTAIGGLFFLLPLAVVLFLVGQVARAVWVVARELADYLPALAFWGYPLLLLIALGLIVLGCFVSGIIARRQFGQRLSQTVETYVASIFPQYTILKQRLSGNLGPNSATGSFRPVVVRLPGHTRLGFEIERYGDHADAAGVVRESVTVYLPGSPDPWMGQVIIVPAHSVEPLASPFGETTATMEHLGRGLQTLIERHRVSQLESGGPVASEHGQPVATEATAAASSGAPAASRGTAEAASQADRAGI
ncbi:MAG: DUF502 domain-containing protein [Planctomycetaceae bacterium]|nr:MAG: DUF502 domain-containing protein [Planctomycetaceae bacterium]